MAGDSETSPLIASGSNPSYLGTSSSDAQTTVAKNASHAPKQAGTLGASDEEAETQITSESRIQQYEGMPELAKKLRYILPAVAIGVFLAAADQTLVASAYGKIGSDLQALNSTSWIATSYFLTLTSFQPLYGKISDIFGRKFALLNAYTIFAVGSLLCGLVSDMNQLIAARALAGIGGGGMTTVVSILLSDIVPLRQRGTWQGFLNIIFASGSAAGAPLGGILADSIGWRTAFIGQAPLCLIAITAVSFLLNLPKTSTETWKSQVHRIDALGASVLVAAIATLLVGLDLGSNNSWSSPAAIVCLLLSPPLWVAFGFVEQKVAPEPFAPSRIIFDRGLFAAYLCNFFSFAGWYGVLFYLPLYYQAVDDLTAAQGGIRLLPGILGGVTGSLSGGFMMQKTGKYYWLTVVGYFMLVIGAIVVFLFTGIIANDTPAISVGLAIGSFGNGVGVTTTLIALISNAAPEDQAVVTACSYLFRSLGSALGISGLAALVQQLLRTRLREKLGGGQEVESIIRNARESLDFVHNLEPHLQELVRSSYSGALSHMFGVMIFVVALAFLCSLFIREKRLSK